MLVIPIIAVIGIAMYAAGSNGEWGAVAIGAVIVVAVLFVKMVAAADARASVNRMHYWADIGRDKEVSYDRTAELRRKQERYENRVYRRNQPAERMFVCHYCGRMVKVGTNRMWYNGNGELSYRCPRCGEENGTLMAK